MTDIDSLARLATRLDEAARTATTVALHDGLLLTDAYLVQQGSLALRVARGERQVGWKMGLTSLAKMRQMNVHSPIYGFLTDAMLMTDGGTVYLADFCHARAEPEVCFVMAEDLHGPTTPAQALAAVRGVTAALEVIDSRYQDFKFDLPNVVADNASSARVVLGSRLVAPEQLDLGCLGILLEVRGRVVETSCSAAVYEHPARSLAKLVNMLAERGQFLRAGQIVMSGAATAAVPLHDGDFVRACIDGLGTAALDVRKERNL